MPFSYFLLLHSKYSRISFSAHAYEHCYQCDREPNTLSEQFTIDMRESIAGAGVCVFIISEEKPQNVIKTEWSSWELWPQKNWYQIMSVIKSLEFIQPITVQPIHSIMHSSITAPELPTSGCHMEIHNERSWISLHWINVDRQVHRIHHSARRVVFFFFSIWLLGCNSFKSKKRALFIVHVGHLVNCCSRRWDYNEEKKFSPWDFLTRFARIIVIWQRKSKKERHGAIWMTQESAQTFD